MSTFTAAGRLHSYWAGLPANFRGIIWLSLGAFLFVIVDVFVKLTQGKFHPLEISMFRYSIGFIILTPAFLKLGWNGLRTQRIKLHMFRMSLAFMAQLGIFITVIYMPLADATAFMFSKPLFTTVVAVFILSEVVSGRRWIATLVGFVGVLVMVRPGSESMDPIALIAVGSAVTFAVANVLIRKMSTTEPPVRILFYYHLGGIVVFAGPAYWVWVTPAGVEWLYLLGIGVFTTAGMFCYVRAFGTGEANAVGPAENLRLIYAALFGFFLFSEVPSIWTVIGASIIVAATYYIARDEARRRS
jgi:drug/metabolite transporter (DMT)-like permease